jgi:hypothetical protein
MRSREAGGAAAVSRPLKVGRTEGVCRRAHVRAPLRVLSVLCGVFALALFFCGLSVLGRAQENTPPPSNNPQSPGLPTVRPNSPPRSMENPPPPPTVAVTDRYLSSPEVALTVMVIALTLAALTMQFFLLRRSTRLKAEDTLRVFGVTLIIMGTLFFIAAGFNSGQIAPAMGLFGTIAGYLLGRKEREDNNKLSKEEDEDEA